MSYVVSPVKIIITAMLVAAKDIWAHWQDKRAN
jgi:hypothetical protein